jgi:uncharacterized membrane protein YfcA
MPESRKREGHPYQKPSDIPARQRTKATTILSLLFAAFALLITYFAAGNNYFLLAVGAAVGGIAGYFTGKAMQRDARK